MNRFEPVTPEQLSPSPMARRIGLDPVWELEKRTKVRKRQTYLFVVLFRHFLQVGNVLRILEFKAK